MSNQNFNPQGPNQQRQSIMGRNQGSVPNQPVPPNSYTPPNAAPGAPNNGYGQAPQNQPMPNQQYQMMAPVRVSSLAQGYAEQQAKPKRNVVLLILVVVLSLVLIGLIGTIVYKVSSGGGNVARDNDPRNVQIQGAHNPEDEKANGVEPSDQSTDKDKNKDDSNKPAEKKFPASGTVEQRSAVLAGSGNIWCQLENDQVSCTVDQNTYEDSGVPGCDGKPVTFKLTKDGVTKQCRASVTRPTDKMDYDHTAVKGNIACKLTVDGMTCWHMVTGKSVFMNRSTWNDTPKH